MRTPSNIWSVRNQASEELALVVGVKRADATRAANNIRAVQESADQEGGFRLHRLSEEEAVKRGLLIPRT